MIVITTSGRALECPGYSTGLIIEPGTKEMTVTIRDANTDAAVAAGGSEIIFGPITAKADKNPLVVSWSGENGGFGKSFGRGIHVTMATGGTGGSVSVMES